MTTSDNQLWTVDEVAELLRVHPETVRRWVRAGTLKSIRLGNGPKAPVRIEQSEVDRFSNNTTGSDRG